MLPFWLCCVIVLHLATNCGGSAPAYETHILLTPSYVPAAMQTIAHLTDALKFELRPQTAPPAAPTPSTTSAPPTRRSTPAHRPGVFQPLVHHRDVKQLAAILSTTPDDNDADDHMHLKWLHRLLQRVDTGHASLLDHFADTNDVAAPPLTPSSGRKVPVTRAYVQLLSTYDLLQKEAKRLSLQRTAGYAPHVLDDLQPPTDGAATAAAQLRHILVRLQEAHEVRDTVLSRKIAALVDELGTPASYMQMALQFVPPLTFAA